MCVHTVRNWIVTAHGVKLSCLEVSVPWQVETTHTAIPGNPYASRYYDTVALFDRGLVLGLAGGKKAWQVSPRSISLVGFVFFLILNLG